MKSVANGNSGGEPELVKVIVIDPDTKTITETKIKPGIQPLNDLLGGFIELATTLKEGDMLFVNDALNPCKGNEHNYATYIGPMNTITICGRAVIYASLAQPMDVRVKLDTVKRRTTFRSKE